MTNNKIKNYKKEQAKNSKDIALAENLYDLNKQIVAQEAPLDLNNIDNLKKDLEDWFNWRIDGYAMLLCREIADYTIFHLYEKQNPNPPQVAVNELIECLKNRGTIISIEKHIVNNETVDSWEIWIKTDNDVIAYYLFNCDDFVIEC